MGPESRPVLRATVFATIGALALLVGSCGGDSTSGANGGGGNGGSATGGGTGHAGSGGGGAAGGAGQGGSGGQGTGGASTGTMAGPCDQNPLKTGLVAQQTGVSVDSFDCQVLTWTAHYGEPDPMIFKAIMYVESRFDQLSVSCPNLPCGTPAGWTADESHCYGLMQVVPACGGLPDNAGLLPNGHPNLTTDMSASGWAGSTFNPDVNIEIGIAGIAGNRTQVKAQFPGCTEDQYTMMAVGNYNSYGSTMSCTVYNMDYDNAVLMAYQQYATAAGYPAHSY